MAVADRTCKYRLRVFDGTYEVLTDHTYSLVIDLDGPGAGGVLDRKLAELRLTAQQVENEPMDYPRLQLHDWLTGAKVSDWSGIG